MRVIGARVLTVLAILLALVGMVAFYVEHTALDEDGFETISRNMIENDEIRTQVASKAVEQLFANVDVEAAIAERLPEQQQGCACPRGSRTLGCRSPRTRRSSGRVADGLGGGDDTDPAPARAPAGRRHDLHPDEGGAVVLDLRPLVIELGDEVAVIGKVAERFPESSGRIAIIEESQLETRRRRRGSCARSPTGCGSSRSRSPRPPSGWLEAPQARAPRARDRPRARGAPDACRTPLRRRLPRRRARAGRRRQAGGTRRLEHPDADSRRPCVGLDSPRHRDARGSGSSATPDEPHRRRAAARSSRAARRPTQSPRSPCWVALVDHPSRAAAGLPPSS